MRVLALTLMIGVSLAGCGNGAPPYASCGGELGCAGSTCTDLLYTRLDGSEGGGAFCTESCTSDSDCTALDGSIDGACVTLDVDPPLRFFCAARCVAPADCYAGLACTDSQDATLGALCLPGR